ncbi:NAD-dependent epimerase/dehydratase family protein [Acuticoccus yangtzensis]|uniref:NAD-dependent epimerase/dehydratase family protein n=1 Tax=Acuticoccus yangtzensis TaxID=1443441 RepID=UPI000A899AC3|nr:NAD-dependent epimerase/dehydratase family protein [Acuticoccus yangtzensis]
MTQKPPASQPPAPQPSTRGPSTPEPSTRGPSTLEPSTSESGASTGNPTGAPPGTPVAAPRIFVLGGTGFVGQAMLRRLVADARIGHAEAGQAGAGQAGAEQTEAARAGAARDGERRAAEDAPGIGWAARIDSAPAVTIPGLAPPLLIDDLEALDLEAVLAADIVIDFVSRGRGRLATRRDILGRIRAHARLIDELANRAWSGHYIYLSSGGTIYGVDPPPVCVETMPVAPFSDYALEKAFIEMHLTSVAGSGSAGRGSREGMALSILRVANAYGEGQTARPGFGVIPAMVAAFKGGAPFKLYGDGTSRRDYVHVDDIVEAILAAMKTARTGEGAGAGTVNIGSGVGTSVRELVALAERIAGRRLPMETVEMFAAEPASVVLDAQRARERLGWSARIGIAEGLARVLAHHGLTG